MSNRIPTAFLRATALLLLSASVACAQATRERDPFTAGAMHLLTELDHLLAIAALSLLARKVDHRDQLWTLAALAASLALGALSGNALPPLRQVEAVNLASIAILGGLVALGLRLPTVVLGVLAFIFGWGHGYANALDLGGETPPYPFVLGVVVGALVVVLPISVTTSFLRLRWQDIAIRAIGSWICAIGLMVFAFQFAKE